MTIQTIDKIEELSEVWGESLDHLFAENFQVTLKGRKGLPERKIRCHLIYSTHCVSSGTQENKNSFAFKEHSGETRYTSMERYELSKKIPSFFRNIANEKCFEGDYRNHRMVSFKVGGSDYQIFFRISQKRGIRKEVFIRVETAYLKVFVIKGRPINGAILIASTLNPKK